jgi:hypothetical protein
MKKPRGMGRKSIRTMTTLAGGALLAACASDFDANSVDPELELGTVQQAAAACAGDDVNYDYNAFAASLAVAVANELGRWDANADFEVRTSYSNYTSTAKLELSTTGTMRCNASPKGCSNITAMLRLQDDASSIVPNHSPAIYRGKLVEWYQKQTRKLTELVDQRLTVDKGIYKMQVRHSGKYMAVDGGSTYDNAAVEQRGSVLQAGADEWRLILQNTKHRFQNVRSGKCLTLSSDSQTDGVTFVQNTCSPLATTQNFDFAQTDAGHYAIRTKWSMALDVNGASTADDARVMQYTWTGSKLNQQWKFVPVGTGAHIDPTVIATAVYSMTVRHSGKAVGVDNGSLAVGAAIEQGTYSASDDRFQWYITQVGGGYQFINRRSGKCLALAADTTTGAMVQQVCAAVPTQLFGIAPIGDGGHVVYSKHGRLLEVAGASSYNDARIAQSSDGAWSNHRIVKLTPIVAGEPHTLTFSHITDDATCGEHNFWYEIAQPNGDPLRAPADSFVQLIFAGGKDTLTGTDINPFIAQQVSGDLVAIDPTYGLNENNNTAVGLCTAACVKVSTTDIASQCCSCNGVSKAYKKSTWNATTFLGQ